MFHKSRFALFRVVALGKPKIWLSCLLVEGFAPLFLGCWGFAPSGGCVIVWRVPD